MRSLAPSIFAALALLSTLAQAREKLQLRELSLDLPGAPAAIVAGDIDGDRLTDLVVVTAYTEWGSIVTEESVEMDDVEGLVEMMTIVPSVADRRQIVAFLGLVDGGFETLGEPQDLPSSVLSVFAGLPGNPILALTDDGIEQLALNGSGKITYRSILERRPLLSGSGILMSGLVPIEDIDGDGRGELFFPGRTTWDVFRWGRDGIADEPVARIAFEDRPPVGEEGRGPASRGGTRRVVPLPTVADLDGDGNADVLLRGDDRVWHRFEVSRGGLDPPFSSTESFEPERDRLPGFRGDIVHFGDLDGDGVGEYVLEEELNDEDAGWRRELKEAKVPQYRYFIHGANRDFSMSAEPRVSFLTEGYGFGGGDDFEMPFGLKDLDADGRLDLVSVTLDFSLWQAVRIMTTQSLSIGLDFHVWCQQAPTAPSSASKPSTCRASSSFSSTTFASVRSPSSRATSTATVGPTSSRWGAAGKWPSIPEPRAAAIRPSRISRSDCARNRRTSAWSRCAISTGTACRTWWSCSHRNDRVKGSVDRSDSIST